MTEISIPKRPTTNIKNPKEVVDGKGKGKSNGNGSSADNAKLVGVKGTSRTSKTKTKAVSKVATKKKETKTKAIPKRIVPESFDINKVLPEGYLPEVHKFGKNEGYVFLPRSIFDWITTYRYDWHKRLKDFPFYRDIDIIYSILYYILEDGFVYVQENRYQKFYQIKISEE